MCSVIYNLKGYGVKLKSSIFVKIKYETIYLQSFNVVINVLGKCQLQKKHFCN